MNIQFIPSLTNDGVNVIIETPQGSHFKYAYDPEQDVITLKYQLPVGYYFPVNFGFIPHTSAEDGDPLDAIVFTDEPLISGLLLEAKVIGALPAQQQKRGKKIRNDRIVVVPLKSSSSNELHKLTDVDPTKLSAIERFFTSYNKYRNIDLKFLPHMNTRDAYRLIRKCASNYKLDQRKEKKKATD